jgi:spoIIIJ-associated protein
MTENQEFKREFTGKTMEEALAAAASGLGVDPARLDVEVLVQPGSLSALLGRKVRILAGLKSEAARGELRFDHAPAPRVMDEKRAARAAFFDPVATLTQIARAVVADATVEARETDEHLILDIQGDGTGIFIGRKGSTLEAIQYLMSLTSQKQGWGGKRLVVDSERYRERRIDALRAKARQMAEKILAGGPMQRTELLDATMRKVVHSEIKNFPALRTKSIGEGDLKRVQITSANDSRGGRRPQ